MVGNDMDNYADDLAELMDALDLESATMVGHSTGGGEVTRYPGRDAQPGRHVEGSAERGSARIPESVAAHGTSRRSTTGAGTTTQTPALSRDKTRCSARDR